MKIFSLVISFYFYSAIISYSQSIALVEKYLPEKNKVSTYEIPKNSPALGSFSIIEPGLCLLPYFNGIYLAGLNSWAWQDSAFHNIIAVYADDNKGITYFVNTNKDTSFLYSIEFIKGAKQIKKLFSFNSVIIDLKSKDGKNIFFWGVEKDNSFKIWKLKEEKVELLISTMSAILDLDVINSDDYIVSFKDEGLLYFSNNYFIKQIIKSDIPFESIATASDGSMFVSTEKGIFRIYSNHPGDLDPFLYYINGPIKLYRGSLYVMSKYFNSIIKIKI